MLRGIRIEDLDKKQIKTLLTLDEIMKNEELHGEPGIYKEWGDATINNEEVMADIFACIADVLADIPDWKERVEEWAENNGRSEKDIKEIWGD